MHLSVKSYIIFHLFFKLIVIIIILEALNMFYSFVLVSLIGVQVCIQY